jgi:hypothetical protein
MRFQISLLSKMKFSANFLNFSFKHHFDYELKRYFKICSLKILCLNKWLTYSKIRIGASRNIVLFLESSALYINLCPNFFNAYTLDTVLTKSSLFLSKFYTGVFGLKSVSMTGEYCIVYEIVYEIWSLLTNCLCFLLIMAE